MQLLLYQRFMCILYTFIWGLLQMQSFLIGWWLCICRWPHFILHVIYFPSISMQSLMPALHTHFSTVNFTSLTSLINKANSFFKYVNTRLHTNQSYPLTVYRCVRSVRRFRTVKHFSASSRWTPISDSTSSSCRSSIPPSVRHDLSVSFRRRADPLERFSKMQQSFTL